MCKHFALTLTVFALLVSTACTTPRAVRVKCDQHLEPINAPAPAAPAEQQR